MSLSPEQWGAVYRSGQDVCVVAGPGSGKTSVLVQRFRRLVEEGTSPARILAITFTERAATEIRKRLVREFASNADRRRQIERAYVSTVHGFCGRLLREHAVAAGLDPRFEVLDEQLSDPELASSALAALDELFSEEPERGRALLEAWRPHQPVEALLALHRAVRVDSSEVGDALAVQLEPGGNDAIATLLDGVRRMLQFAEARTDAQRRRKEGLEDWLRWEPLLRSERPVTRRHLDALGSLKLTFPGMKKGDPFYDIGLAVREELLPAAQRAALGEAYAGERRTLVELLRRMDSRYREAKRVRGALDFNDLEHQTIRLLETNERVRARVQASFDAILMDELQDTNPMQWRLMELLRLPGTFFGVGDINQSIYSFRHADPDLFRGYREAVAGRGQMVDELRGNYRSRPAVLAAVERVSLASPGVERHRLVPGRSFADKREPCVEVLVAHGEDADAASEAEALWLAQRLSELEGTLMVHPHGGEPRPARFGDMAVLVRSRGNVGLLEQAFQRLGLPHVVTCGTSFFSEQEVVDLTHWLRTLANTRDELSMLAVLRSPLVGVSDETLLRMRPHGTFADALEAFHRHEAGTYGEEDRERLWLFRELLRTQRPAVEDVSPDRLLARVIDDTDYEGGLPPRARANIDKLLTVVRELRGQRGLSLPEILQELDRRRAAHNESNAPATEAGDAIQVLTMHGSKGLEFPIVALASLHRGTSNESPAATYAPGIGLGVRWWDPFAREGRGDEAYEQVQRAKAKREEREADRLLYVAMTRAEEHLLLSYGAAETARGKGAWVRRVEEGLGPLPEELGVTVTEAAVPVRLLRTAEPPSVLLPVKGPGRVTEPLRMPRPAAVDFADHSTRVTDVSLFSRCPRQYYLAKYVGWQEEGPTAAGSWTGREGQETGELRGSELGDAVHAYLRDPGRPCPFPEAIRLGQNFLRSEWGRRAAAARRVEREFSLVFLVEDVILDGQIDLWFEEQDGGVVLLDYKSDRIDLNADWEKVRHYQAQLRLYAAGLGQLLKRPVTEAALYFLRPDAAVPVTLGSGEERAARRLVQEFRAAQGQHEFPARVSELCDTCRFARRLCPARAMTVGG